MQFRSMPKGGWSESVAAWLAQGTRWFGEEDLRPLREKAARRLAAKRALLDADLEALGYDSGGSPVAGDRGDVPAPSETSESAEGRSAMPVVSEEDLAREVDETNAKDDEELARARRAARHSTVAQLVRTYLDSHPGALAAAVVAYVEELKPGSTGMVHTSLSKGCHPKGAFRREGAAGSYRYYMRK